MALMAERFRLAALLPDEWERDVARRLSRCAGSVIPAQFLHCISIHGVQTRECGHTSRSPLDSLETAIGFHMRDW